MKHVTIIGGGIAGLAAAFHLQQKSKELGVPIRYTLVESSQRLGGKILTHRENGFVVEGGPDSFITQKPAGLRLCHELGLDEELIPCNEAKQFVYLVKNGRLVKMPAGYRLAAPTQWRPFLATPLMTLPGKLRVAMDLFIPRRKETGDESIGDFMRRRFGQEALEALGGPVMAGIYVADHDKLSLHSTFPMFAQIEQKYGSVIRGLTKARKAAAGRPKPPALFMSFKDGMQTLSDRLASRLDGELRTGDSVSELRREGEGYTVVTGSGETFSTDAVVLALPPEPAAGLLAPHDSELADGLRDIRSVSTAVLSLGYRKSDVPDMPALDGFGFVVPKTEKRPLLACTWSSTKFASRAPEDSVLLRAFVGGDLQESIAELPEAELVATVREELDHVMQIRAEPVIQKMYRWPKGNPQYDVGHPDRVSVLEKRVDQLPGIYLTGSAYRGIGIPDCIQQSEDTVDRLLGDLSG